MATIQDLQPQIVWRNFYGLTRVPRPSGHLEKVQQYLLGWAREHGIEAFKDGGDNIVMRKPATPGRENSPIVVMQAHMDMVPQKTQESTHNFETDPIETWIDGEWLRAKGTTLGADDGIGVACILAALEDETLQHGPIEALITSDEETCMWGVNHLEPDTIQGRILLNIDNEKLGEFVIGSAGGVNISAEMGYKEAETPQGDIALKLVIGGMRGGHSGLEINQNRGNANKMMARLLQELCLDGAQLAEWHGGNMRNAIPRHSEAIITIQPENEQAVRDLAAGYLADFAAEEAGIEEGITLTVEHTETPKTVLPEPIRDNIVNAVIACHDGVLRFIPSMPTIVETSSNLAIVNVGGGKAEVLCLARSSNDSYMNYECNMIESAFSMAGMNVSYSGEYGAWQPDFSSKLVASMVPLYEKVIGTKPEVQVCHAGLECSLIGAAYPGMDMVSMGPTLLSPHTPDERCHIPSVAEYWKFFRALVESI